MITKDPVLTTFLDRPSLGRPANTLYRHNLTSTLETAIRGSLPPSSLASPHSLSILRRLDARISDFQQGEVGWDVFLLEYKVDAPLSTVLDPKSLEDYREMFRHLWGIKRVEYVLNEAWRTLMTSSRLLKKGSSELRSYFSCLNVLTEEFSFPQSFHSLSIKQEQHYRK